MEATINASGTLEPMEVVDVGAQVAGRIKSSGSDVEGKPVDYGSVVEEGAVLARIDDSVYAADLAVAKAQVEHAAAGKLSVAASGVNSLSQLYPNGSVQLYPQPSAEDATDVQART